MYNLVSTLAPSFLIGSSSFLQVRRTTISRTSSKFCLIRQRMRRQKKILWTYNGRNVVSTLAPLFLIVSSPFLQVWRATIKAWMSSNFDGIPPRTAELAALECVKNLCLILCKHSSAFIFGRIFILTGKEDNYNISNEFKIRPDSTADCRVSCP